MNDKAAIGNIDVEADPGGGKYFGSGGRFRKSLVRVGGRRTGGGTAGVVLNVPKSSEVMLWRYGNSKRDDGREGGFWVWAICNGGGGGGSEAAGAGAGAINAVFGGYIDFDDDAGRYMRSVENPDEGACVRDAASGLFATIVYISFLI